MLNEKARDRMTTLKDVRLQAREYIKYALSVTPYTDDDYTDDEGQPLESVYLGTLINPSGKFYMPFACSNVETCPQCNGNGCKHCGELGSREAYEDSVFWDELERLASKHNGWIESGEGDPCDSFFVRYADIESDKYD